MSILLEEKLPFSRLLFASAGAGKFDFKLRVDFNGAADQTGECTITMSGSLNPFIKKMAEKPIENLVNVMAVKLSELQLPVQRS